MKPNQTFEWLSDKEEGWDELPQPVTDRPKSRQRLILQSGALLLLFVVGMFFYLRLSRRVRVVTDQTADELLASHWTLYRASLENDDELFASLVYPEDTRWYKLQRSLQTQQLFLNRAPLGLWAQSLPPATEEMLDLPQTVLSPDLTQGVVVESLPYIIDLGRGVTETILLERTTVYRLYEDRWLLGPPQDERMFWGSWIQQEGNFLRLSYPARDEEIGRRLFSQLDGVIALLCGQPEIMCSDTFLLKLRLSRDPDSLLGLREVRRGIGSGSYHMDLPAPTWVGRPLDEAGYQALYRGYAGWIATALVNSFSVTELVDEEMLDSVLQPLALRAPPLPYARPLQDQQLRPVPLPSQDILLLCDSFLPPRLLRYDPEAEAWHDSADDPEKANFLSVLRNSSPLILSLPDDTGILAQVRQAVEGTARWRTFIWQDDQERLLVQDDAPYALLPPITQNQIDPTWQRMVFYSNSDNVSGELTFHWIDQSDCPDATCLFRPADGLPLWSPNRERTLLTKVSYEQGYYRYYLFHGDRQALVGAAIGPGTSPFWIDDLTYAYVRPKKLRSNGGSDLQGGFELVAAGLPVEENGVQNMTVWLDSEELLASLPALNRPKRLWIRDVSSQGDQSGAYLIWATSVDDPAAGSDYIFSYDVSSDAVYLLLDLGEERLADLSLPSGNQRYIALVSVSSASYSLWVLDLTSGQSLWRTDQRTLQPVFDWAAGGQWLVLVEDGLLKLIAPGYGYEKAAYHNLSGCRSVAWVNR